MTLETFIRRGELARTSHSLRSGADVNQTTADGLTPLMIASALGQPQMVELLLTAGANALAVEPRMGATALHKATQSGNADVLHMLLNHGAFIDQQSPRLGNTPLTDAVLYKQHEAVRVLLDRGARTHIQNHWNQTALELARADGLDTIADLIVARDEADSRKIESLRLLAAAKSGNLDTVKHLVAANAPINERAPIIGSMDDDYTPLGIATREGHLEIVQVLLEAGADPRRTIGLMKGTAIHDAAFFGNAPALRVLLAAYPAAQPAEIDAQGPYNGLTALHDAVWHGHSEAVRVLVEAGAPLDVRTHTGRTPRDLAVLYGYDEMAEFLGIAEQS